MQYHKHFQLAAGLAAVLGALAPVSASADVSGDSDVTSDIIVTATGAPQDRDTAGQAITIIDKTMIETRQAVSLAELLATTPGVTYSRSGGPGGMTSLRIRGAEDRHTLTLIDGVRVNDPTSTGGAFDFGNLLSLVVDHVEVLRGPNSVPWGSDAIGGVVDIVTDPITEQLSASAGAEYGYKDSVKLAAHVSGASGPISASIGGGYFRDDGISSFRYGTERDGYRQYALTGKVGIAIGPDAGLDFRAYYADSKRDIDGFPPPFFTFSDTGDISTTKELTTYAGGHFTLFDGAFRNRLAFTLTDVERDDSFRGAVQRIEYRGDADISTGVRGVFGAEHVFSRAKDSNGRSSTSSNSGYGQLILTPVREVTLTGGLRVDDYRTYGTKTTFAANAAWRPAASTTIRASYAEGFKAPTLYQLFSTDYGTTALQPETARSYEVGVEQRLLDRRMTIGFTAFQRDVVNLIDFQSCGGMTTGPCAGRPNGIFDGVYVNVGKARARGVEAEISLRPTDNLTFDANYTYTDAEDRQTGLPLLRRPKHSINASVDWEAVQDLKLGATVRTASSSDDFDYQTFGRTTLGGYTLVALRASLSIGEHYELYGRVENFFDEKYEIVSGYGTVGRAAFVGVRAKL